jgi:hypothetical protein
VLSLCARSARSASCRSLNHRTKLDAIIERALSRSTDAAHFLWGSMKTEQTLQQMGEYRCTRCGQTVNLAVDDDTAFTCAVCGGNECEMDFAFGTPEPRETELEESISDAYENLNAQLSCIPLADAELAERAEWALKLNRLFADLVFLIRWAGFSEYTFQHTDSYNVISSDGTYTVHETTPDGEHINYVMTLDGRVTVHETTPDGNLNTCVMTPDGGVTVLKVNPTLSNVN